MRHGAAATMRFVASTLVGFLAFGAGPAHAQHGTLRGIVTDSSGAPVSGADVGILAQRELTKTDSQGRFWFTRLRHGEVEVSVRRLGFEPQIARVVVRGFAVDSVTVTLVALAASLERIDVRALEMRQRQGIEGFHRRRIQGLGTYVARDALDKRYSGTASDMLRTIPGLRFVRMRGSNLGVRFTNTSINRRDCMPMIWIDGQAAPGFEIDDVALTDIEGIELYSGPSTTPMEFSQAKSSNTCGTIVIWSRPPPLARARP